MHTLAQSASDVVQISVIINLLKYTVLRFRYTHMSFTNTRGNMDQNFNLICVMDTRF